MVSGSDGIRQRGHIAQIAVSLPRILTQGRLHCTQHAILRTALQVHTRLVREAASKQVGVLNIVTQHRVSAETGSYTPCHWSAPGILNPQHPP